MVVGDHKSPDANLFRASFKGNQSQLTYLDADLQAHALPYRVVGLIPWNIGYLFAIHHGAHIIFDVDDDSNEVLGPLPIDLLHLPGKEDRATATDSLFVMIGKLGGGRKGHRSCAQGGLFNPYEQFRLRHAAGDVPSWLPMWPRGFPIDALLKYANCTPAE